MNICVIGTGYVGLVGAAVFAGWGNKVVGVDIDVNKIAMIKKGRMPIFEPGLPQLVKKNINEKKLTFTTNLKEGIKDAEVVFICVGTPQDKFGGADLSAVWAVAQAIGKGMKEKDPYRVIVTKSTVPVGTNEEVAAIIKAAAPKGARFDVASNPEFLREGYSIEDMQNTDRTVIGSNSSAALKKLKELYSHLKSPIVECDLRSAEMVKYASNAFLATKISFINELAQLCERAKADVSVVAAGMGFDKRIGRAFLNAGIGFGGSCFPKDVSALFKTSTDQDYDFKLLRGVMEVNDMQKDYFVSKVLRVFGDNLHGVTLACLGLAFKENTDDVRESVAIRVARVLRGHGAALRVYDPEAAATAKAVLGDNQVYYAKDEYDALKGANAICILTEWNRFRNIDLGKAKKLLTGNHIFDGRNLLVGKDAEARGFVYHAVGKWTNGSEDLNGTTRGVLLNRKGNGSKR